MSFMCILPCFFPDQTLPLLVCENSSGPSAHTSGSTPLPLEGTVASLMHEMYDEACRENEALESVANSLYTYTISNQAFSREAVGSFFVVPSEVPHVIPSEGVSFARAHHITVTVNCVPIGTVSFTTTPQLIASSSHALDQNTTMYWTINNRSEGSISGCSFQ